MDIEPSQFCCQLIEYSRNNEPANCRQLLKCLDTDLEIEQNLSTLNQYFIYLFDENDGLLLLIENIKSRKQFKECVKVVLEILYKFINNFNYKLEKYVITINTICLKVINCTITQANEKCRAYDVLSLSFEKIHSIENVEHYQQLFNNFLESLKCKQSDSVQGKILSTLGVFAKNFQYLVEDTDMLQRIFLIELEKQMVLHDKSNKIITGVFEGLTGFKLIVNDPKFLAQLFDFIGNFLELNERTKVHNRAALTFFGENIELFTNCLINTYKDWHKKLLEWLQLNTEESKVAYKTILQLYRELSNHNNDEILWYFHEYFKNNLNNSNVYEKKSILQGLYLFSNKFSKELPEQWTDLTRVILRDFEDTFVLNPNILNDDLEYLPDYLCAITSFGQSTKITNNQIFCLQNGILILIRLFPNLPIIHHNQAIDSVMICLNYFKRNQNFIHNIIYQSVLWTCSQQHQYEIMDDNNNSVTLKKFMPFWNGILRSTRRTNLDKFDVNLQDRQQILTIIIDNLLKTLLIAIEKLNLTLIDKRTDLPLTDLESMYQLIKINDFAILLNLVDFYEVIFNEIDPKSLDLCIFKIINRLISKCNQNPFMSGFYKLLTFILKISNRLNKFNDPLDSLEDLKICYESLLQFFNVLLEKIQQFKDDLLISCLNVLLEYPIVIVTKFLNDYETVFKQIFNIGRINISLMVLAIEKLEIWQNLIDFNKMELFLIKILPILDTFLQSKSLSNFNQVSIVKKRRKTKKRLAKQRISIELEAELLKLQRMILKFLGQQNGKLLKEYVLNSNNNQELTNWNKQQYLKLLLPYDDYCLDIYLDQFIPRLIHLSLNCSDSKIRFAACELLHSTIMVFLGTSRQMTCSNLDDLNDLFKSICSTILQLGCDHDLLVQQLYEPLCLQLTHWYTNKNQLNTEHTNILIDTIIDGITHSNNSRLRDFCGRCINELIHWTIKQSSMKNLINNPIIFEKLLWKIRYFSTHPDQSKKRGAALIFNNIYRLIREEEKLIQQYWQEYLFIFINSLSLIHNNYNNDDVINQIEQSLEHLERVLVERPDLFQNLTEICLELLKYSGNNNWNCRQKSMELFWKITPKTENFNNFKNFLDINLEINPQQLLHQTYANFIMNYPTINDLKFEIGNVLKWLQSLLCTLDGWIFIGKLYGDFNNTNQILWQSIDCFLEKIALFSFKDMLNFIKQNDWIITPFHQQEFDYLKIKIIQQILQINCEQLWNLQMFKMVQTLIFEPEIVSLTRNSTKINCNIMELLKNILLQLTKQQQNELFSILNDHIKTIDYLVFDLKRNVSLKQRNLIKGLLYLQLLNFDEIKILSQRNIDVVMKKFFKRSENFMIYIDNLQDTTLKHCSMIFEFALNYPEEIEIFVDYLYKSYQVQQSQHLESVHFGLFIIDLFRDVVMERISKKFDIFLKFCLNHNNMELTIDLIQQFINYLLLENFDESLKMDVLNELLQNWKFFENYLNLSERFDKTIDFIRLLLNLSKSSNDSLINYLINLLITNDELEIEQKIIIIDLIVVNMDGDQPHKQLRELLNGLIINNFNTITPTIFDKLLLILPKTKSVEYFEFLIRIYLKLNDKSDEIIENFNKFLVNNNSNQLQMNCLNKLMEISNDRSYETLQLYKLIPVIDRIFQKCNLEIFQEFFIENIDKILEILECKPKDLYDLLLKIQQFKLIEILFSRIPLENNDEKSIISKYLTNRQLLKKCLSLSFKTIKEDLNDFNQEFVRLYRCYSYNCSISIICNSFKDIKFYEKLFNRQVNNEDALWTNLIDLKQNYCFNNMFKELPQSRKILINIRDEIKREKRQNNINQNTIKYLQTQRFLNNTLSEDITKYDLSYTHLRIDGNNNNGDNNREDLTEVELENVEINNHECMGNVCGLIQHLIDKPIINDDDNDKNSEEIPFWVIMVRNLLLDPKIHTNIKIFWIKVLHNIKRKIDKNHFQHLIEPILKFIVDKCAGGNINYFVSDAIVLLATFSTDIQLTTENELNLLSDLIEFLIVNINNEHRNIFKYHLELFRTIIESWSGSIKTLPYNLLLNKFNNNTGIHLSAILIANQIEPWHENFKEFCMKLFKFCSNNNNKPDYQAAAETIGLLLNYLNNNNDEERLEKVLKNTHILLQQIDKSKKFDKYSTCLELIVGHYSGIIDEYNMIRLLNKLNTVPIESKIGFLKIILKRTEILGQISEFSTINWWDYLENDNKEIQYLTLELIYNTLDVLLLLEKQFIRIIQVICKNSNNSDVRCRSRMYDILICLKTKEINDEIRTIIQPILINGLTETEKDLRLKIYQFWEIQANLPDQITTRFTYLLKQLYLPEIEEDFLGITSHLLLILLKNNDKLLFDHPLEKCDFQQQILENDLRTRHSTFTPMFVNSLQSQSMIGTQNYNKLRQTQQVFEFEPTPFTLIENNPIIDDDSDATSSSNVIIDSNRIQIKRFLDNPSKISRNYRDQYLRKAVEFGQQRQERIKQKENQVDVLRNYRKGDFPDIQIKFSDIIKPLLELIVHDYDISKIFYISLFKQILQVNENSEVFLKDISNGITKIFQNSSEYNTNLFRTLFELILSSKCCLRFDVNLLTKICEASGLITMGCLILEEYLNNNDDDMEATTSKKSRGSVIDPINNHWIKLAELYKSIEEWDVIKAIFLEKIRCSDAVTTALKYESEKDWSKAQNIYKTLIQDVNETVERKDFYYESYFKCFAHLSEWKRLTKTIEHFVNDPHNDDDDNKLWLNLFDNGWNQQKLLPWYINGKLKTILLQQLNQEECNKFFTKLKQSLSTEKSKFIQKHYTEELCILWINQDNIDKAKQQLHDYIDNFLNNWQLLDPIYFNLRFNQILKLHNIIDIKKFINIYENLQPNDDDDDGKLENLLNYWHKTNQELLPTILLNETRILYRRYFTHLISKKIQNESIRDKLNNYQLLSIVDLIDEALRHKNYYLANKYHQLYGKQNELPRLQLSLSRINYLKSTKLEDLDKKSVLLENVQRLKTVLQSNIDDELKLLTHQQLFVNLIEIGKNPSIDDKFELLSKNLNNPQIDCGNFNEIIVENFQNYLNNFEDNLKNCMETNDSDYNLKSQQLLIDCFIKLMHFTKDSNDFDNFVFYLLKAMQYESIEARQYFPCIIMEKSLTIQQRSIYLNEIQTIPDWMFLIWIPQLLINIDTNNFELVSTIIERISKRYPQSIMYAYRLSKEHYKFEDDTKRQQFIKKLDHLLLDYKGVEDFLKALSFVSPPSVVLKYYLEKMITACRIDDDKRFDDLYKKLNDDIFGTVSMKDKNTTFKGKIFNQIDGFRDRIKKLTRLTKQQKLSTLQEILKEIPRYKSNELLKYYSPWLANFIANNLDIDLEIPGQYHGKRIPLPQYHIKISSFLEHVTPMKNSLRQPIKITILGNNMKQYPFLVKFGEDIRQDQRIQQLFNLTNDIFNNDLINHKQLSIDTYQVVPLTTNLGIIEWVENTIQLSDFMQYDNSIKHAIEKEHSKWIGGDTFDGYGKAAINYNRQQTIAKYCSFVNRIPANILKLSLINLSSNMESFFALRNNFIKSYAVLCTTHWLLGIGDRHLNNSLISIRTGRVIGIDFGYAFGTATQMLPVPELVPFRLTPHLIDVMLPLGECGIFKQTMLHCLTILRTNQSPLLATLKVFIEEPSIDWCELVKRSTNSNIKWSPIQKIQQAEKKLNGTSSVDIMVEDLQTGRQQQNINYLKAYLEFVYDNRRQFTNRQLTVDEQVECLLNHATDYNLLGRMYSGWMPWI